MPPHDYIGQDVSEFWNGICNIPNCNSCWSRPASCLKTIQVNKQREERGLLPANGIWLWGEGKAPTIPTIKDNSGLKGSLISAVDLLKGIGSYGGLDIINVEGATGDLDTNYAGKAAAALKALEEQDFVFVHVEAPDEAGHQGSVRDKVRAIEDFDSKIVKPIFRRHAVHGGSRFSPGCLHGSLYPISIRTHSGNPVPVLLYDSRQQGPESGLPIQRQTGRKAKRFSQADENFSTSCCKGIRKPHESFHAGTCPSNHLSEYCMAILMQQEWFTTQITCATLKRAEPNICGPWC